MSPTPPLRVKLYWQHQRPRRTWLINPWTFTDFQRFPVGNFTYYFTLSPECFSTFPHGTCSLSVSRQYLALDGVYHPIWAAIPNNPTLWRLLTSLSISPRPQTGLSPSMALHSRRLWPGREQRKTSSNYNSLSKCLTLGRFQFELFPLHSPLLRESLLVSFPPLINMLKFSG